MPFGGYCRADSRRGRPPKPSAPPNSERKHPLMPRLILARWSSSWPPAARAVEHPDAEFRAAQPAPLVAPRGGEQRARASRPAGQRGDARRAVPRARPDHARRRPRQLAGQLRQHDLDARPMRRARWTGPRRRRRWTALTRACMASPDASARRGRDHRPLRRGRRPADGRPGGARAAPSRTATPAVFFGGSLVAWTGLWMHRIAVAWLAWELTGNAASGSASSPSATWRRRSSSRPSPGAVADRVDRVRLSMVTQAVIALQAAAVAALAATGSMTIGLLLVLEVVRRHRGVLRAAGAADADAGHRRARRPAGGGRLQLPDL